MRKNAILCVTVLALVVSFCTAALGQEDPQLVRARDALRTAFHKYDRQISAVLTKAQDEGFNQDNEDLHFAYFSTHALTRAEANGYEAFLAQKLKLDPQQQEKLMWIERRMLKECVPLQRAYEERLRQVQGR